MKIIIYPNKILSQVAERVEPEDDVRALIKSMILTMRRHKGGGLAAPQIGVSKRVVVWEDFKEGRCFINPVIVHSQGKVKSREGCLSVPNIQRDINRKRLIEVVGFNLAGESLIFNLTNREAIVVQHEMDHLDGITILDGKKRRRHESGYKKTR